MVVKNSYIKNNKRRGGNFFPRTALLLLSFIVEDVVLHPHTHRYGYHHRIRRRSTGSTSQGRTDCPCAESPAGNTCKKLMIPAWYPAFLAPAGRPHPPSNLTMIATTPPFPAGSPSGHTASRRAE